MVSKNTPGTPPFASRLGERDPLNKSLSRWGRYSSKALYKVYDYGIVEIFKVEFIHNMERQDGNFYS